MPAKTIIGWDLGGAHLKAALVTAGALRAVRQLPCPLWQSLAHLQQGIDRVLQEWPAAAYHAVTMTGELADLFPERATGVQTLVAAMRERLPDARVEIYAGRRGLVPAARAGDHIREIASANWLISAGFGAARLDQGVLIDCGSTTTDLIAFADGAVCTRSVTDADRLTRDELVYSGVVRTPVCAVAQRVPFAGEWQTLAAELFATMADVYRLLDLLPGGADQLASADGRGKSLDESAARLARMLGRDRHDADHRHDADLSAWRRVAAFIARRQQEQIHDALDRVLSAGRISEDAPLVGAGCGRFLVRRLAERCARPYRDFGALCTEQEELAARAADCAPAVALALALWADHVMDR